MSHLRMSAADFVARQAKRTGNKFNARKKVIDGIEFDSTHEAERYQLLQLEVKAGTVRDLKVHVPIQVHVKDPIGKPTHVFTYECDFVYDRGPEFGPPKIVYEDAKGYRKGSAYQLFRLKKSVIAAALGIVIEEV